MHFSTTTVSLPKICDVYFIPKAPPQYVVRVSIFRGKRGNSFGGKCTTRLSYKVVKLLPLNQKWNLYKKNIIVYELIYDFLWVYLVRLKYNRHVISVLLRLRLAQINKKHFLLQTWLYIKIHKNGLFSVKIYSKNDSNPIS